MNFLPSPTVGYKDSCRVASVGANLALSTLITLDGVALSLYDRVLVKDQTNASQNGIYLATAGAWPRAIDLTDASEFQNGHQVAVSSGAVNGRTMWMNTNQGVITVGTTNVTYTRIHPDYLALNPTEPYSLGQTMQRSGASAALLQASGTLYLHGGVVLRAGVTYSAINCFFTTASSGLTHSWGGIVRQSDRSLLAVSADNTGAISAGTVRTFTFASSYTPLSDTPVWFAVCLVASTTVPSLAAAPAMSNAALSGLAPVLVGTSNTGQTTPLAANTVVTAPTATTQVAFGGLT